MSQMSEWVRTNFSAGDAARDEGLKAPEDIARFDNIVYGKDSKWQSLDVYRPRIAGNKKLPVIVSVHGGGWVYGDKDRYQYYCMSMAQNGFAVVNYSYRLAPENKFPAPLEDTNQVFFWILEHAEKYGFDINHIFGVGDSAGGHLLGLYSAICTNRDYAEKYTFKVPAGFRPTAIALNCGAYRIALVSQGGDELTYALMEDLMPEGGTIEELAHISVLNHITHDFPPVFLMTSSGDFLNVQAPLLADVLLKGDVPFVYRYYSDDSLELPHVFHCNIRLKAAVLCNTEECNFFKTFCWENREDL